MISSHTNSKYFWPWADPRKAHFSLCRISPSTSQETPTKEATARGKMRAALIWRDSRDFWTFKAPLQVSWDFQLVSERKGLKTMNFHHFGKGICNDWEEDFFLFTRLFYLPLCLEFFFIPGKRHRDCNLFCGNTIQTFRYLYFAGIEFPILNNL